MRPPDWPELQVITWSEFLLLINQNESQYDYLLLHFELRKYICQILMRRNPKKFLLRNFIKFLFIFSTTENWNFGSQNIVNMSDRNLILLSNFIFFRDPLNSLTNAKNAKSDQLSRHASWFPCRSNDTFPAFQLDCPC